MRGPLVLATTVALLAAAPGAPAATPLVRATGEDGVALALAGDAALYTRPTERRLELRAVPVTGGSPVTRLAFQAPEGTFEITPRLAASAQVAALTVITEDDESTVATFQAFLGPPAGLLAPLGPLTATEPTVFIPALHAVDGPRVFTTEIRGDLRRARMIVREPGAEPSEVPLPQSGLYSAVFAGDLVAYAVPAPGQPGDDEPRRLVVAEWRTGRRLAVVRIRGGVESLALASDGRVIVGEDGGGLVEVAPGAGGVRRLSRVGTGPVLAGRTVVARREAASDGRVTLLAIGPDRRVRRFGVPAASIDAGLVRGEGELLVVRAVAVDPAGRRTVLRDGYGVSLPR